MTKSHFDKKFNFMKLTDLKKHFQNREISANSQLKLEVVANDCAVQEDEAPAVINFIFVVLPKSHGAVYQPLKVVPSSCLTHSYWVLLLPF